MILVVEARICLERYDSGFLLARGVTICGYRALVDLYCAQTAVVHTGIDLEGKQNNVSDSHQTTTHDYNS